MKAGDQKLELDYTMQGALVALRQLKAADYWLDKARWSSSSRVSPKVQATREAIAFALGEAKSEFGHMVFEKIKRAGQ